MSDRLAAMIAWMEQEIADRTEHGVELGEAENVLRTLQWFQRWEGTIRSAVKLAMEESAEFAKRLPVDEAGITINRL